jgi:hypothetical protein
VLENPIELEGPNVDSVVLTDWLELERGPVVEENLMEELVCSKVEVAPVELASSVDELCPCEVISNVDELGAWLVEAAPVELDSIVDSYVDEL